MYNKNYIRLFVLMFLCVTGMIVAFCGFSSALIEGITEIPKLREIKQIDILERCAF